MSSAAGRETLASVRRLALAHMWVAFALFAVGSLLGVYQLLERDHLVATSATLYYESTTLHGVVQAFVLTTFFIVGFGYAMTAASLARPIRQTGLAWLGFWTMLVGSVIAALSIAAGKATVLYTFYPPMVAHWTFYGGAALLLVGSLAWTGITIGATVVMEAREPRPAGAAGAVRHDLLRRPVGMDARGRRRGGGVPAPSALARPLADDRRRPRAGALLVDAPSDRLLLAHPGVRRPLLDPAESRRRIPLLRRRSAGSSS